MKIHFAVLFAVLTLAGVSSFAETDLKPAGPAECRDVDVRNFQETPEKRDFFRRARHQSDTGWCYAYAASDILTDLYSYPVSAFAIAMQYNSELTPLDQSWRTLGQWIGGWDEILPSGGLVSEAVLSSLHEDLQCRESVIPSDAFGRSSFNRYATDLSRSYERVVASVGRPGFPGSVGMTVERLRMLFPTAVPETLRVQVEKSAANGEDLVALLARIKTVLCSVGLRPTRRGPRLMSESTFNGRPMSLIRRAFASPRPRPVAILMDSDYVYTEESAKWWPSLVGDHYSVIVRQRWNPSLGRCEYLIRDSFGTDCRQYRASDVRCECQDGSTGGRCIGTGAYWVNESYLNKMIVSATVAVGVSVQNPELRRGVGAELIRSSRRSGRERGN